jgi:hypothetical protein
MDLWNVRNKLIRKLMHQGILETAMYQIFTLDNVIQLSQSIPYSTTSKYDLIAHHYIHIYIYIYIYEKYHIQYMNIIRKTTTSISKIPGSNTLFNLATDEKINRNPTYKHETTQPDIQ